VYIISNDFYSEGLGTGVSVTDIIESCQIEDPGSCSVSVLDMCSFVCVHVYVSLFTRVAFIY